VRELVADEEVAALLGEVPVDDAEDALHLVLVPLDGRRQLLVVVVREPAQLPEVGPLAANLEVLPAARRAPLLGGRVVELGVLVVFLDQVVDDGTRLFGRGGRGVSSFGLPSSDEDRELVF
jgi:hypothetical protein